MPRPPKLAPEAARAAAALLRAGRAEGRAWKVLGLDLEARFGVALSLSTLRRLAADAEKNASKPVLTHRGAGHDADSRHSVRAITTPDAPARCGPTTGAPAVSFLSPSVPAAQPRPPPMPKPESPEVQDTKTNTLAELQRKNRGRRALLLTGGQGAPDTATLARPTLLGN